MSASKIGMMLDILEGIEKWYHYVGNLTWCYNATVCYNTAPVSNLNAVDIETGVGILDFVMG